MDQIHPFFRGYKIQPLPIKWYAVTKGRVPGVYSSWEDTEEQVKNYPGADYKSFPTEAKALQYIDESPPPVPERVAQVTDYGLNAEQKAAFDLIVQGKSIFITGPGGTGKSFLLQTLYANYKGLTGKTLAITAMTGCAALLLGPWAKTLHSWACIGIGRLPAEQIAKTIATDTRKKKRWRQTDCLVIDEVSMLQDDLFFELIK
jgi:DNA replication protein DnaC